MTTKEKVERLQFLVDDKIELIRWIMLGTPIFEVIPGIKCLAEFTETPVKNVYNLTCSLLDAVAPEVISFEKSLDLRSLIHQVQNSTTFSAD